MYVFRLGVCYRVHWLCVLVAFDSEPSFNLKLLYIDHVSLAGVAGPRGGAGPGQAPVIGSALSRLSSCTNTERERKNIIMTLCRHLTFQNRAVKFRHSVDLSHFISEAVD